MKLSKRIAAIFLMTTISTVIMFIISSQIMIQYFYTGEADRIGGKTGGSIIRLGGEINKIRGKSKEYASLVVAAKKLEESSGVLDAKKILGFEEKYRNDDIDTKLVLDREFKVVEEVVNNNKEKYTDELLGSIIEISETKFMEDTSKGFAGVVSVDDSVYVVSLEPLRATVKGEINGYFLAIDTLGNITENVPVEVKNRSLSFTKEIPEEKYLIKFTTSLGYDIDIEYRNDKGYSYYKIPQINGDDDVYLASGEYMVVKRNTTRNLMVFTIIIIIACGVANRFLYTIIEKLVVKRIGIVNEGINRIKESKDLKNLIPTDDKNDEIAVLTKDINEMFVELETANENLEIKEKKYANVLDTMSNGFAYFKEIKNQDGKLVDLEYLDFNNTFLDITALDGSSILNKRISEQASISKSIISLIEKKLYDINNGFNVEVERKIGNRWVTASVYSIEEGYIALILNDITKIKEYSEEMKYLASYDILTSLLNRYNLYSYMQELIGKGEAFAAYFIDLDNFKNLNDSLGHNKGDTVLCLAAKELTELCDETMKVGRLGGDEFIVIKEGNLTEEECVSIGEKIQNKLNRTISFSNYTFELKGSIGASMFPYHTDNVETLLQYADIAMYEVKKSGGCGVKLFSNKMKTDVILESKLITAIENNQLEAYYQPIYSLKSARVTSAEALVRWNLDGKLIYPDTFLKIAKKNGFILDIDHFMLLSACNLCKTMRETFEPNFSVSVNMSYLYLKQPNFKEKIFNILKETGLEANGLKLEITEDEILEDLKYIVKVLQDVKEIGVQVSLDDFGVGYSSFNHVKMLPIDTLKIDRSILQMAEEDKKTMAIIETLIKFAHTLDLDVICEGVEIKSQLEYLKNLSCDSIQGYLISKPINSLDFTEIMKNNKKN